MKTATLTTQPTQFLEGWRKLPDELKLKVLRHAVPSGQTFGATFFNKSWRHSQVHRLQALLKLNSPGASVALQIEHLHTFHTRILPLLACSEIAAIVPEAFYTQNTMAFEYNALFFPPPSVGVFVRRLEMHFETSLRHLAVLEKLASGKIALPNLQVVHLDMDGTCSRDQRKEFTEALLAIDMIRLSTRKLHVKYEHAYLGPGTDDLLEMPILAKLSVKLRGKQVQERLERYYRYYGDREEKPVEFVDMWPKQEEVEFPLFRMTRKVVWS